MKKLTVLILLFLLTACDSENSTDATDTATTDTADTATAIVEKPALPPGITLVDEFAGDDGGIAIPYAKYSYPSRRSFRPAGACGCDLSRGFKS